MKKTFFFFSAFLLLLSSCGEKKQAEPLQIIPQPVSVERQSANFEAKQLSISVSQASLNKDAELFAKTFTTLTGIQPQITAENNGNVTLTLEDNIPQIGDEGYILEVGRTHINIKANTSAGIFYGLQTLLQLPIKQESNKITIPCVTITDYPRFAWRGNMMDVSRHFFSKEEVKKQIDLIAQYKFNTFHWHLTDDQGWRIEIKKYPELTELGAWRIDDEDENSEWDYFKTISNDPSKKLYGGFFTQEEIKEVVQYAAERHITIVPEIEFPGHANAVIAAYNSLNCSGKPFVRNPETPWEFFDPLCLGNEETYSFAENVLSEVFELFPGEYIHIGGDECKRSNWEKCPRCRAVMQKNNLKDASELQSYFNERIEKFCISKGKKMIGWDEILEGGLSPTTAVMSWRGEDGGIAAAKAGHNVVMTPGEYLYFNRSNDLLTLETVYNYDPVPSVLTPEESQYIMGAQANLWAEEMKTYKDVQRQTLPRILALAEIDWTPKEFQNYQKFCSKLPYQLTLLEKEGYEFYIPAIGILNDDLFYTNNYDYTLPIEVEGFDVRYTLDGSDPDISSPLYTGPIRINATSTIKAAPFMPSGKRGDIKTAKITKTTLTPAVAAANVQPGLDATYFRGMISTLADFNKFSKIRSFSSPIVGLPEDRDADGFGLEFNGYLSIDEDGVYNFALKSDDGSELFIDDIKVIDADGIHGDSPIFGRIALAKGLHKIQVRYFDNAYGEALSLEWGKGNEKLTPIPSDKYFQNQK